MNIVYDPFETVPISDFVHEVVFATGDCPEEIAENYIRHAIIDFAERSQVLIRRVFINLQACVSDYLLEPPTCERIVSIQRVCTTHGCGDHVMPMPHGPCRTMCGYSCNGSMVWYVPPNTINVLPAPSEDRERGMWVDIAVAPHRDACEVDKLFYERYHEAIINGTLSRLFLIRSATWYEPTLAMKHEADYNKQVSAAGMDRLTGNVRGPFKMRPRRVV